MLYNGSYGCAIYVKTKKNIKWYKKILNVLKGKKELNYEYKLLTETIGKKKENV